MSDFPDFQARINDLRVEEVAKRIDKAGPGHLNDDLFVTSPELDAQIAHGVEHLTTEELRDYVCREVRRHSSRAAHDRLRKLGDRYIEKLVSGQLRIDLGGLELEPIPVGAYVVVGEGSRVKVEYLEFDYFEMQQLIEEIGRAHV